MDSEWYRESLPDTCHIPKPSLTLHNDGVNKRYRPYLPHNGNVSWWHYPSLLHKDYVSWHFPYLKQNDYVSWRRYSTSLPLYRLYKECVFSRHYPYTEIMYSYDIIPTSFTKIIYSDDVITISRTKIMFPDDVTTSSFKRWCTLMTLFLPPKQRLCNLMTQSLSPSEFLWNESLMIYHMLSQFYQWNSEFSIF